MKKRFNDPLQLQIHTDVFSPYFCRGSFLNMIRVLLAKFLIPRADCVRVVSGRIADHLKLVYDGLRIAKLPVYVDVGKIREAPVKTDLHKEYPQFDFIILMASRLTREKNIGLAIKAMAEVVRKHPKTGLIIVGSGPEDNNLISKIKNLKLSGSVIVEPWTDDIISYYKTADLFLLTSNYEGYGMSVVEAMAGGLAVIMTDVGLAGEVLVDKKDGIVIPVADRAKLTEAILSLMENTELRNGLIENSKRTLSFWPSKDGYLRAYRDSWLAR